MHAHDHAGCDHHHHHDHAGASHGTLKSYLAGFGISIVLTVIPFWMVMHHVASRAVVLASIVAMAVVQIVVHLVYFLHMNNKSEQRWNNVAFVFTVLVVALVIGGSLWIMANATDNMMPMPSLTTQE